MSILRRPEMHFILTIGGYLPGGVPCTVMRSGTVRPERGDTRKEVLEALCKWALAELEADEGYVFRASPCVMFFSLERNRRTR